MRRIMSKRKYLSFAIATLVLVTIMAVSGLSQTSDFTYQGRLLDSSLAANGNYDFQFSLYDAQANGNLLQAKARSNVQVSTGIFSVRLDFSAELFDGTSRFLEIAVKPVNDPGQYITLAPRQPITSAPYTTRS